jgi:hypothetical protein
MNAPEKLIADTNIFVTVPETAFPNGHVEPAFQVGQFLCSKATDGQGVATAVVTAEGTPWVRINFKDAKAACEAAGAALITELQWLAIAHNVAAQDCNWTKGKVGEGKLFRGLRKGNVSSAQPGTYEPTDPKERRWLTLSNGERLCDFNGNAFSWVFDNVQGDAGGLTGIIEADSMSLQAPFPSEEKGMGWRPDGRRDWSGLALIRGGYWFSESNAGVFFLYGWHDNEYDLIGFRCTKSIGL